MKRYEIYKVEAQEPGGKWREVTTYPSFPEAERHVLLEQRPENGTLIPFRIVQVSVSEYSEVVQTYVESPKMTPLEQFHYDSQTLEMALGGMYALNQIKPFADGPGLVERIRELALRFDANPPKETQDKWAVMCTSYDDLVSYSSGYRSWFHVYDTEEEAIEAAGKLKGPTFEGITRETLLVCRCSEVQDMLA